MTTRCRFRAAALVLACSLGTAAPGQSPIQPKVAPGPNEPDWVVVLRDRHGLSMVDDLLNPAREDHAEVRALFRKAAPGPVTYRPVIALGLETRNRGGWYRPAKEGGPEKSETWSYTFKNTTKDLETGDNLPPPLEDGSNVEFDPGDAPFGLWVSNDGLDDGGVFTEPAAVARVNKRLASQPYKAMIYPNRDKATGKIVPNSYIVGWEYSTNDDFQDVVCQVDNVVLLDAPTPR
jgi:hypothetical protein